MKTKVWSRQEGVNRGTEWAVTRHRAKSSRAQYAALPLCTMHYQLPALLHLNLSPTTWLDVELGYPYQRYGGWQVADGVTCCSNLLASIFHSRASHCLTGGGKAIFVEGRGGFSGIFTKLHLSCLYLEVQNCQNIHYVFVRLLAQCLNEIQAKALNCLWNVDVFANNVCMNIESRSHHFVFWQR